MIDVTLVGQERIYPLMTRLITDYGTCGYVRAGERIWAGDYLHLKHQEDWGTVEKATEIDFDGVSMVGAGVGDYFWMGSRWH